MASQRIFALAFAFALAIAACEEPASAPPRTAAQAKVDPVPSSASSASNAPRCTPLPREKPIVDSLPESPRDDGLLARLASTTESERYTAASEAAKLHGPARWVVPSLLTIIRRPKEPAGIQTFAARALGRLRAVEATPDIMRLVERGNITALDAVVLMGPPALKELAAANAKTKEDWYAIAIEQVLRDAPKPEEDGAPLVDALFGDLVGPKASRAATAASSLAFIGEGARSIAPSLVKLLDDSRDDRRAFAAWLLGFVARDASLADGPLRTAAKDKTVAVRLHATTSLLMLGKSDASAGLASFFDNDDPAVRRGAAFAVEQVAQKSPAAIGDVVREKLAKHASTDREPAVREIAGEALAALDKACPRKK